MSNPVTLSIIGAGGKTGSAIAKALSGYYRLLLSAKELATLEVLQTEIMNHSPAAEIEPVICSKDACWEADIIILAVGSEKEKEVADVIREVAANKTVIRLKTNAYQDWDKTELQKLLPHSHIIHADGIAVNESYADENINNILAIIGSCMAGTSLNP